MPKYKKTAAAVAAYDQAWKVAEAAELEPDMIKGLAAVDRAENEVRKCWAEEAAIHADMRTAQNVRELGMPTCPADWRSLRRIITLD